MMWKHLVDRPIHSLTKLPRFLLLIIRILKPNTKVMNKANTNRAPIPVPDHIPEVAVILVPKAFLPNRTSITEKDLQEAGVTMNSPDFLPIRFRSFRLRHHSRSLAEAREEMVDHLEEHLLAFLDIDTVEVDTETGVGITSIILIIMPITQVIITKEANTAKDLDVWLISLAPAKRTRSFTHGVVPNQIPKAAQLNTEKDSVFLIPSEFTTKTITITKDFPGAHLLLISQSLAATLDLLRLSRIHGIPLSDDLKIPQAMEPLLEIQELQRGRVIGVKEQILIVKDCLLLLRGSIKMALHLIRSLLPEALRLHFISRIS